MFRSFPIRMWHFRWIIRDEPVTQVPKNGYISESMAQPKCFLWKKYYCRESSEVQYFFEPFLN